MLTVIKNDKESRKLVEKYNLTIYQEWESIRDFLTPLILEDIKDEAKHLLRLIKEIEKPTLYYKVMEDDIWYYIAIVVYHPWDWSDHPIAFIRKWDSHRHDTESILMRVKKKKIKLFPRRVDICTVYHKSFVFKKHSDRQIYIQPQGHGIRPFKPKMLKEERNFIRYKNYNFVNWANVKKPEWEELRKRLNGINLPDMQHDTMMKLRFRRDPDNHRPGDNWKRPDVLFHHAERSNRI